MTDTAKIDALTLYKAYYRYLQEEPRDMSGDLWEHDPHRINIRHIENLIEQGKDNFIGQYGYAKHIGHKAEQMRVMVDDPQLGGHYEVMIDEQGEINPDRYAELCDQYREEMEKAAKIYGFILQYEDWIAGELRAIDTERAAAVMDKINFQRARDHIVYPADPGIEQTLF